MYYVMHLGRGRVGGSGEGERVQQGITACSTSSRQHLPIRGDTAVHQAGAQEGVQSPLETIHIAYHGV